MDINTKFDIGQQVKPVRHPSIAPGMITAIYVGPGRVQYNVEYVNGQNQICSSYFEEQDLVEA